MVNFHDPAKLAQDFLAVLKLWHTMDGIYIWEFFVTLDYELSVIRGRRPYRWTIWIYSFARLVTLLAVITNMLVFDASRPTNCQALATLGMTFGYIAYAASSLLIVLRTIAIWNRKPIVIIIAMGTWLTNVSFFIEGLVRFRAAWSPMQGACTVINLEIGKPVLASTLANDLIMPLTMFIGLLRMRHEGGSFGLARLLWTQGIIWLFLATVAEVPTTVFICLNLNYPYNLMFQGPAMVTLSIAATRMYRFLSDFGSRDILPQGCPKTGGIVPETRRIPIAPFSPNRMEVELGGHTTSEQFPALPGNCDGLGGLYINTDGLFCDKSHRLSLGEDREWGGVHAVTTPT